MRPIRLLVPLALLGLAACGGPLLDAEVVVDRFCFTQPFTGLPPVPPTAGTPVTIPLSLQVQLPPLLRTKGEKVVLRLLDATVDATSPGTDLSPVVRFDLESPGLSPPLLARYDRPATYPTPLRSFVAQGQGVDVAGATGSGTLQIQFTIATDGIVSGSTPGASWDANLTVCFYGKTVVSYL